MRYYGYKFAGYFMEYGPVEASDPEQARNEVRRRLGVKRLPAGMEIWDLHDKPISRWKISQAS